MNTKTSSLIAVSTCELAAEKGGRTILMAAMQADMMTLS